MLTLTGALADRFHVREELGEGGMGVVYRAWDERLGKEVALKRMHDVGPREVQRLKSEFRARRALQHRNLVQLFELVVEGDDCFFTMELVEGTDLATWIRHGNGPREDRPGPASSPEESDAPTTLDAWGRPARPRDVPITIHAGAPPKPPLDDDGHTRLRATLTQLCVGLAVLHDAGIIHRDVKPANVRVTPAGRVVILDFGLAASPGARARSHGGAEGTPRYMAPEQVRAEPATAATDLYALGVVLYELLAGKSPFPSSVPTLQLHKLEGGRAEPLVGAPKSHPLAGLALALLEPDPAARPDIHEVLTTLAGDGEVPSLGPTFGVATSAFFGREREKHVLDSALARASGTGPVAVLVEGPSGIGKTTFVRWFLADLAAREPRALVLPSRCHPQESVAFKALDAAMDALADHASHLDDLEPLSPALTRAAVRLFPVLRSIPSLAHAGFASGPEQDESELRTQGALALRELFALLAQRGPVVLWIDDVQWDDADSLTLLDALLRPRGAPPLLLVLSMRSESSTSAIVSRLEGPGAPIPLERVRLGPLDDDDVASLASSVLGAGDERIDGIVTQSEGNAFLACELARYLASSPSRTRGTLPPGGIDVQSLVAARLGELLPAERALLDVAALSVRPLSSACAIEAAHLRTEANTTVLALRDAFLLRQSGLGRDEIAPYHDRIAEATQRLLTPDARTSIHRSLAIALEKHAPDDAVALAVHWEGAGDLARAGTFAFQAAEQAAQALAFLRAAELYDKAVAAGFTGVPRAALVERAGKAYASHGRAPEAARRYLEASALLGGDINDAHVRTLKRLAAEQYVKSGRVREGWQVMRSVLEALDVPLPKSPRRAMVAALERRMRFLARRIDLDAIGDRTIPEAERPRIEALWTASTSMSMVNVTLSDAFRTLHLERILDVGDRSSIARALAYEVALEAHVGGALLDWHGARLIEHASRLVERTGDPYDQAWLELGIANQAFCAGRFRDAVRACETSEAILRTQCHGVAWEITTVSSFLSQSVAMLGDLPKLREITERIVVESELHGDLFGLSDGTCGDCVLAWWTLGRGDDALARGAAAVAKQGGDADRWPEKTYRRGQLTELTATIHLRLLADDPWPAWEMLLAHWEGLESAMIPSLQFYRSWLRSARARVALAAAKHAARTGPRGGWSRARLLADARAMHAVVKKDKKPFGPPWAALIEGALARAEGDERRVRESLERAVVAFDRAEMALYREAARHRLASITGAPTRRAEAEAWLRAQGVPDVDALVNALVPGY